MHNNFCRFAAFFGSPAAASFAIELQKVSTDGLVMAETVVMKSTRSSSWSTSASIQERSQVSVGDLLGVDAAHEALDVGPRELLTWVAPMPTTSPKKASGSR